MGGYRQVFKENGVNDRYLESMSTFTTEQILRGISEGGTEGASSVVDSVLLLSGLHKCSEAQQTIKSRLAEAGTMKLTYPPETAIRECYFHAKQE